jgi:glucose/arabinose dehydrogenase
MADAFSASRRGRSVGGQPDAEIDGGGVVPGKSDGGGPAAADLRGLNGIGSRSRYNCRVCSARRFLLLGIPHGEGVIIAGSVSRLTRARAVAALLVLAAAAAARAQAPDCTGVSGVFNSDADLVGELTTRRIASGLDSPVFLTSAPGDTSRLFILEQRGRIRVVKDGALLATPFLDIESLVQCCGEEGLLGLAFHPDYASNDWFFVYHTNLAGDQEVARYTVSDDPDVADAGSRAEVITIPHPSAGNHNGGMIAFSPLDGKLYIGTGDGGGGCDPGPPPGNAQMRGSNLGKLLRLGVDSLPPSTAGNPFDGVLLGRDEIWSLGLRNPWRWSFDRSTGAIYIGDVGQGAWEEIDCVPASSPGAENYGWVPYEGDHCPNPSCGASGSCVIANYVPPIREFDHAVGCAVTGGYVYRGCRMVALHGTYFYSDLCNDFVPTFQTDGTCAASADVDRGADLEPGDGTSIETIVAFGEDQRGELYIVDYNGEVFKVLPELSIMEVSGLQAPQLLVQASGDFTWEALEPGVSLVQRYRVYRSIGGPTGPFDCRHLATTSAWIGGEPDLPAADQVFYYLITARSAAGVESTAGARSDGTLRTVNTGSVCPL